MCTHVYRHKLALTCAPLSLPVKTWCLKSETLLPCLTASATASTWRCTSDTAMLSSRITRQMGAKNSYLRKGNGDKSVYSCSCDGQTLSLLSNHSHSNIPNLLHSMPLQQSMAKPQAAHSCHQRTLLLAKMPQAGM
jgi:hypothetical protein